MTIPAPAPHLNTQPKGTTCEDCQRFRKEECPYPESNITITRCNSFIIDLEVHDTTTRNAAIQEFMDCAFLPGIVHPDSEEGKFLKVIANKLRTKEQP